MPNTDVNSKKIQDLKSKITKLEELGKNLKISVNDDDAKKLYSAQIKTLEEKIQLAESNDTTQAQLQKQKNRTDEDISKDKEALEKLKTALNQFVQLMKSEEKGLQKRLETIKHNVKEIEKRSNNNEVHNKANNKVNAQLNIDLNTLIKETDTLIEKSEAQINKKLDSIKALKEGLMGSNWKLEHIEYMVANWGKNNEGAPDLNEHEILHNSQEIVIDGRVTQLGYVALFKKPIEGDKEGNEGKDTPPEPSSSAGITTAETVTASNQVKTSRDLTNISKLAKEANKKLVAELD